MKTDFKHALRIGITIGIALIPTEYGLNFAGSKALLVYIGSVIIFPILAILGLYIGKLLFYRFPAIWQFVKFGLVGVANTAINFGILNLFVETTGINIGWPVYLFATAAFVGALVNSYIWNSYWTFEDKDPRSPKEFFIFFLVTFIGSQLNSLIVYFIGSHITPFAHITQQRWLNIANVIATLTVMFWNFFGFKFIVFGKIGKQELAVSK